GARVRDRQQGGTMSKKRSDVFAETIVGIFMAAVLALLVYFTIVISGVDILVGHTKVPMKVEFTDVGGLKDRDSVMYRGMKVGVIEQIDLSKTNVVMTVRVTSDVVLREGYRISVASLSLLGGNYLLLEEGAGKPLPLETTLFRGEPPTDWMRDIGRIASSVGDLMSDGGIKSIVTNIEAVAAKLNVVVTRVERGEGTVGKLLSSDETVYNDLKDTISSAKAVAGRLERGEGTVGKFLSSDETVYNDIKDTVASAKAIAGRLERGEGTVGKLVSSDDTVYQDLKASLGNLREVTERLKDGKGLLGRLTQDEKLSADASAMIEKLAAASTDLATVASRLEKGEGTLGKLSADSKLYDEVTALLKDVRQIIDNYRDTTPISTFGSLIGGAL
ncbi:MAG: MCE family protein, partial [Kiritimatiellae bacterium]|nr:MCE family protein [Kiritimatiellia bacterium]